MKALRKTTVVFLVKCVGNKITHVCLGMKKRGFGMGRWNGVGGKVKMDIGETVRHAAIREAKEEFLVDLDKSLKKIAINKYFFINNSAIDLEMHIFLCNKWKGTPTESEEMKPRWFKVEKIPYKKMWDSDHYWLPLVLKGKKLRCKSYVDDKDITIKREIKVVKTL
jgi:ADP-ribose pyrophosphatase YjhB (NUDIX family)